MRLACVFNPFKYKLHEENLRIVQRYFGLFPPLSMLWVTAIAERAGHDVILIDARTLRLTKEDVLARLKEWKPDILGFMMTTYMFRETYEWIQFLKKHLNVPVIVGGYNLRVYPKASVMPEDIDFGCFSSAYYTVPRLLEELAGQRRFDTVPGLIYKENGEVKMTEYGPEPDFENYPNPARHLVPNELYAEFPSERRNFTVQVTSKGCPMGCTFCEAGRTPYNPRSPMTVVNEMQECQDKFGIHEIDIFDYEFAINRKRTHAICDEMIRRKLDILWACRARVDSVDEPLLRKMKTAGCGRIYFGIESGSQEILNQLNKGITLDKIRETVGLCKSLGIRPLGFFLVGVPGETPKTFKQTMKFAKSLKLDYIQFSKLTAKPLTPLLKKMVEETGRDYWEEYILGKVEEQALPRPWTTMTNDEIDEMAKKAYVSFHCRPAFLLSHTLKVRSFDEFKRKAFALLEMVARQEKVSRKDDNFLAYPENKGRLNWYKKISKWSQPF